MITFVLSNDFGRICSTIRRKSFDKTSEAAKESCKFVKKEARAMNFSVFIAQKRAGSFVRIFVMDCEICSC